MKGEIMGYIDVAQVVLYAFWIFFAGLIFYLRREDRREGFPLEDDVTGRQENNGIIFVPAPKTFALPHGGTATAPNFKSDNKRPIKAVPVAPWSGAPLEPTGDPMVDGVGPGSWCERAEAPDRTIEGEPRIVPLRSASAFYVDEGDADPRGMKVVGADGKSGGTVVDLWVDRSETMIRYLEVEVPGQPQPRRVLLPMTFASINGRKRTVTVDAVLGSHFAKAPGIANPSQVTLREEDRICGFYGGGTLYATAQRTESWL